MCGIVGQWSRECYKNCDSRFRDALKRLLHRGPDGCGIQEFLTDRGQVTLGHTRLSIIDLSSSAQQPMNSKDGRWWIVFNGEIYNFVELRSDLEKLGYTFKTKSDTEVLLAAWVEWGSECLPRLNGMFAFSIYDNYENTITCVRDAFGVKPLFFSFDHESLSFASEISALVALLKSKPSLDLQVCYDYLVHGVYDRSEHTFYSNVSSLMPGHLLRFDISKSQAPNVERWYFPENSIRSDLSFVDAVDCVRQIFLRNIELNMRSDVPIGAALSGGLDSSAIVCAMRYLEPHIPINTFSFIPSDPALSELKWVRSVNSHVGAVENIATMPSNSLADVLDDLIVSQGEPFGSASVLAQGSVYKLAKERGVTVTLDGQGADELFAGYLGYPGQRIRSLLETGQYQDAFNFLNQWSNFPGRNRIMAMKYAASEFSPDGPIYELLRRLNGKSTAPKWIDKHFLRTAKVQLRTPRSGHVDGQHGRRVVSALSNSLFFEGLTHLLRHGDRNSMFYGVESRVPFLSLDLAQAVLSLPEEFLISANGETKHILKAALRGIVPDIILDRKDKVGFFVPEEKWVTEILRSGIFLNFDEKIPLFNINELKAEIVGVASGRRKYGKHVWRILNFLRWYNLCYE